MQKRILSAIDLIWILKRRFEVSIICLNLSTVKARAQSARKITWNTTEVASEACAIHTLPCSCQIPIPITYINCCTVAQYLHKFEDFSQQHTGKTILLMKMINVDTLVKEKHNTQIYRQHCNWTYAWIRLQAYQTSSFLSVNHAKYIYRHSISHNLAQSVREPSD